MQAPTEDILKTLSTVSFVIVAISAPAASAVTITPTVTHSAGTTYSTAALTGFMTTNNDMVGSVVTVSFLNGTRGTATWTSSGAFGTGWSLIESGDTFSSPWTFSNTGSLTIASFSFDGVPGNTTFDIVSSPDDSPGSASGQSITSVAGPAGLTVAANYTNQLQVGGVFYGDEYTTLALTFGGTGNGLGARQSVSFVTDTDNARATGPGGGITPVPEPMSLALLGAGVLGAMTMGQRRRA